jgi:hypothetical protein
MPQLSPLPLPTTRSAEYQYNHYTPHPQPQAMNKLWARDIIDIIPFITTALLPPQPGSGSGKEQSEDVG